MNLMRLISAVKNKFGFAEEEFVISAVNSLEHRIRQDMLIPAGIEHRKMPLDASADIYTPLLLPEECLNLYFYHIACLMSAEECDSEQCDIYKKLFNQLYSEIATDFRKKYCPVILNRIGGKGV